MAGDTSNPRLWYNADVWVAPVGTAQPTNTSTNMEVVSASWIPLGLLGEDGMTEAREEDSSDFYAWGGILIRTVRSKHKRTFTVTVLEDTATVFDLVNPGSTDATAGGVTTRNVNVPVSDPRAFTFELTDGAIIKRIVVPRGEVVEVGDVTYSDSEITTRELTINVYPDADSLLFKEITDDPQGDDVS